MGRATQGSSSRIRPWLDRSKPVDSDVAELAIDVVGESEVIASWTMAEIAATANWPDEVMQAAQDDCNVRSNATRYALRLVRDGSRKSTYQIRCVPDEEGEATYDGSLQSVVAVQQRQIDRLLNHVVQLSTAVTAPMMQTMKFQQERIHSLEVERNKLVDSVLEIKTEVEQARSVDGENDDEQTAKMMERVTTLVEIVGPLLKGSSKEN
jgi:hypothetical protein